VSLSVSLVRAVAEALQDEAIQCEDARSEVVSHDKWAHLQDAADVLNDLADFLAVERG
jgi:hypothetical protein